MGPALPNCLTVAGWGVGVGGGDPKENQGSHQKKGEWMLDRWPKQIDVQHTLASATPSSI